FSLFTLHFSLFTLHFSLFTFQLPPELVEGSLPSSKPNNHHSPINNPLIY
ncbi:MAG: hypothetical protein ACJAZG_000984, partial [Granulosicoccus sp.]